MRSGGFEIKGGVFNFISGQRNQSAGGTSQPNMSCPMRGERRDELWPLNCNLSEFWKRSGESCLTLRLLLPAPRGDFFIFNLTGILASREITARNLFLCGVITRSSLDFK